MDSIGDKLDLTQVGTRYDHYMELKEVFMSGIEVINGMRPTFVSEGDRRTKAKLENAVELIDRRIRYFANYDDKIVAVGREVKAAGIHKPLLLGAGNDKEQPKDKHPEAGSQDKSDNA